MLISLCGEFMHLYKVLYSNPPPFYLLHFPTNIFFYPISCALFKTSVYLVVPASCACNLSCYDYMCAVVLTLLENSFNDIFH